MEIHLGDEELAVIAVAGVGRDHTLAGGDKLALIFIGGSQVIDKLKHP